MAQHKTASSIVNFKKPQLIFRGRPPRFNVASHPFVGVRTRFTVGVPIPLTMAMSQPRSGIPVQPICAAVDPNTRDHHRPHRDLDGLDSDAKFTHFSSTNLMMAAENYLRFFLAGRQIMSSNPLERYVRIRIFFIEINQAVAISIGALPLPEQLFPRTLHSMCAMAKSIQ